jgi:hypothetical protein
VLTTRNKNFVSKLADASTQSESFLYQKLVFASLSFPKEETKSRMFSQPLKPYIHVGKAKIF